MLDRYHCQVYMGQVDQCCLYLASIGVRAPVEP